MVLKKAAVLFLAIGLTALSAAGCSRRAEQADNAEGKKAENVAMGRYVENEIKMPEAVLSGEEIAYLMEDNPKTGTTVFSTTMNEEENKTTQYILKDDGSWEMTDPGWLNREEYGVMSVAYKADGTGYAVTYKPLEDKIEVHIIKSTDGEEAEEIPLEDYKDAVGYEKLPYRIEVLTDDKILLFCQEEGTLYEDGKAVSHFEYNNNTYALYENFLLTVNSKGDGFLQVDITTGKTIREVPYDGDLNKMALTADKNGNW